ncbi:hypothetical protein M2272_000984 [Mycobacterium frederiksbergense]|uniref:Uncharacterized protein n=1 Tax=Mycolicibacterium frederiksbergense TaxID=117567 RepID=A0ABT6KUH5_9MYCO|nr:hypothetical protein [Mycolicibacterium frederiksbergense]
MPSPALLFWAVPTTRNSSGFIRFRGAMSPATAVANPSNGPDTADPTPSAGKIHDFQ